jgi:DNA-binding transcriptional MocR family regulator
MLEQSYISGDGAVNIARSVEQGLAAGRIRPGDLLPPVRDLASGLGLSAATVAAAYRLLRDRGVVIADGRRGTRVRSATPITLPRHNPAPAGTRDLAVGNPDPALLPDLQGAIDRLRIGQRMYGGGLNDPDLLDLARRQFAADRIPAGAVTVVSGALDGIERVLREHVRPGDRVIVEDPCFTGIADLLAVLALVPLPVPVDDHGLRPDALRDALRRNPAAMIITPRAQNPTGAAHSAGRAQQLRAVLRGADLLLIEDDHAGVVAGTPYRTLVTAATPRWAVVRSASKSLGPDLRLAVLAGDRDTVSRVEGRQNLGIRWVSHLLQRLVVILHRDKRVKRLLVKAAKTYAERRASLIRALSGHGIEAHGVSGLNVWIPVPDESRVVSALLARGWAVTAGERYRIATAPAIRVTVSDLGARDASRFADDLAGVLAPAARASVS